MGLGFHLWPNSGRLSLQLIEKPLFQWILVFPNSILANNESHGKKKLNQKYTYGVVAQLSQCNVIDIEHLIYTDMYFQLSNPCSLCTMCALSRYIKYVNASVYLMCFLLCWHLYFFKVIMVIFFRKLTCSIMAMPHYPFIKDFEQLHGCNKAAKFAT